MASQIFNFPGFFDREIDLTSRQQAPVGVPYGVIGTAEMGPAFVPITVGSFADFNSRFGTLDPNKPATYAVERALANKTALTFIRVLGAGSNADATDIDNTRTRGTVKNAGFVVSGAIGIDPGNVTASVGSVQFIVAKHFVSGNEVFGLPMFSDNNSITSSMAGVYLTRGMIFAASGTRLQVLSHNENWTVNADAVATPNSGSRYFKIAISSSAGAAFGTDDGFNGVRIYTASLDPADSNYFAKLLNTDPKKFSEEKHLVYADFAVDAAIATLETGDGTVAIASGTLTGSATSGIPSLPFLNAFGRFDTRYTTPKTPWFISQPYGNTEYDLFYFEAISDGAYANNKVKVSITNILKSANPRDKYGSFNVLVRAFDDTDFEPKILEQFNNVTLDPESDNFIGRIVGDKKARFNFDVENEDDRRLITTGLYPNRSRNVRVVISQQVMDKKIPADAVPFGFRGPAALNTNSLLIDTTGSVDARLGIHSSGALDNRLRGSIVPPLPYVFKVTRGDVRTNGTGLVGAPGNLEITDARLYWGTKFSRNSDNTNPNNINLPNDLVETYTKFLGIEKLDTVVTGTQTDAFNNNKFTLAKVALGNTSLADVTSSANVHMKEAAYIRNGVPDGFEYKIQDQQVPTSNRITLATLYQKGSSAADFNKFSGFAKYTVPLFGGFDGVNILDQHAANMDDRSTSTDSRSSDGEIGNAASAFVSPGLTTNVNGSGEQNSTVNSYRVAADIITDAVASNINILALPGQRDALITDYVSDKVKDFGLALYVMDIPTFDSEGERIWDGEVSLHPDVEQTSNTFEARALDNEFAGAYFPDIIVDDNVNGRRVTVPASVAALGALGFNDRIAFPWFAPAGFNRAALDFVQRTRARLVQSERERLFDVHINPIVRFPRQGFVIFAQNTLEQAESAFGSINVVRMLNEVKRQIIDIGNRVIFDQADQATRETLTTQFKNVLNTVAARQGIERFSVIIDDTNNTALDAENNRINAKIVLVPTRAVEFIAIDFIITRSGVQFQ